MRLSGEKVEINELEEKVKMKRFWYRAFVFPLCAVLFLVAVPIQVSALSYNPQAAVQYASEHWNDGVGLCATFVSNCLKAGGCTVSSSVVSGLNRSLTESGYATRYLLKKTSTYYVYQSENQGKVAAGDPYFFIVRYAVDGSTPPFVRGLIPKGVRWYMDTIPPGRIGRPLWAGISMRPVTRAVALMCMRTA